MPRTRRYIFNTLTVVSLLLMLATVGLWVSSYLHSHIIQYTTQETSIFTNCWDGRSLIGHLNLSAKGKADLSKGWELTETVSATNRLADTLTEWRFGDFGMGWNIPAYYGSMNTILFPHWFLALIFAILPTVWLIKWRKRRALGDNVCVNCGYDLTGNTTGKCSECGEALANESPAVGAGLVSLDTGAVER